MTLADIGSDRHSKKIGIFLEAESWFGQIWVFRTRLVLLVQAGHTEALQESYLRSRKVKLLVG